MKRLLAIDAVALVACAVAVVPSLTGVPVHEWMCFGLFAIIVVHCAQHADWVADTLGRLGRGVGFARAGRFALDATLLLAFMTTTVSGLGISGSVLQAFDLFSEGYYAWAPLHAIAAKALLALVSVHAAVHVGPLRNRLRGGAMRAATIEEGDVCDERRSA